MALSWHWDEMSGDAMRWECNIVRRKQYELCLKWQMENVFFFRLKFGINVCCVSPSTNLCKIIESWNINNGTEHHQKPKKQNNFNRIFVGKWICRKPKEPTKNDDFMQLCHLKLFWLLACLCLPFYFLSLLFSPLFSICKTKWFFGHSMGSWISQSLCAWINNNKVFNFLLHNNNNKCWNDWIEKHAAQPIINEEMTTLKLMFLLD